MQQLVSYVLFPNAAAYVSSPGTDTYRARLQDSWNLLSNPQFSDLSIQYPVHLSPPKPFQIKDGWILGPNQELVLWIPPENRAALSTPHSCIIASPFRCTELDFRNFKCGPEWMDCWGCFEKMA